MEGKSDSRKEIHMNPQKNCARRQRSPFRKTNMLLRSFLSLLPPVTLLHPPLRPIRPARDQENTTSSSRSAKHTRRSQARQRLRPEKKTATGIPSAQRRLPLIRGRGLGFKDIAKWNDSTAKSASRALSAGFLAPWAPTLPSAPEERRSKTRNAPSQRSITGTRVTLQ
jgi:hypothetical protein